jgi:hypothetical protein
VTRPGGAIGKDGDASGCQGARVRASAREGGGARTGCKVLWVDSEEDLGREGAQVKAESCKVSWVDSEEDLGREGAQVRAEGVLGCKALVSTRRKPQDARRRSGEGRGGRGATALRKRPRRLGA